MKQHEKAAAPEMQAPEECMEKEDEVTMEDKSPTHKRALRSGSSSSSQMQPAEKRSFNLRSGQVVAALDARGDPLGSFSYASAKPTVVKAKYDKSDNNLRDIASAVSRTSTAMCSTLCKNYMALVIL